MRKQISILLAGGLALSLAACGKDGEQQAEAQPSASAKEVANFNKTGFPIVNDKITLKMMGPKSAIQPTWDKMDVFVKLEEMTGISFSFDTPLSSNYTEKKSIMFASNELPDVFFGRGSITADDEAIYGAQGLLIPLEGLIDQYAPNLKKLFQDNPEIKKSITSLDNHIYSLPSGTDLAMNLTTKIWINQEWLSNLGLKMPQTTDELHAVLKAFKEQDPNRNGKADEIPLSFSKDSLDGGLRNALLTSFGYTTYKVEAKDDKVVYVPAQTEYKEYLAFMKKLFSEKLVDEESFSQSAQQLTAKGNEGRVGMFFSAGPFLVVKSEDNDKYAALPPLTSSVNSKKVWPKSSEVASTAFAISKNNKFPEATIRWVDYLYSEEGTIMMHNGIENKHWKWSDSSKTQWERVAPPEGKNAEEFRASGTPNAGTGTPEIWPGSYAEKQKDPLNAFIRKEVKSAYEPYWKESFPNIRFSPEDTKKINTVSADLKNYITQMEAKFILGQEPLDNWDTYLNNMKKMGMEDMTKIYEDGYKRWKELK
ncbi:MAG: transporter substrate-binding protein [Paenibacillaceae bacterium]|jgi:putative aldouronate transport system substrate-binding protein|nr:transporter substrate-binding protein [Paenibacillaceae bacterium]